MDETVEKNQLLRVKVILTPEGVKATTGGPVRCWIFYISKFLLLDFFPIKLDIGDAWHGFTRYCVIPYTINLQCINIQSISKLSL